MVSSNPALPLGFTYFSRISLSAEGEPVKRPVFIPPGVEEIFSALAAPAADQASSVTNDVIHAHAASAFFAPAGITNEVPPATVKGFPSLSLKGTAEMLNDFE